MSNRLEKVNSLLEQEIGKIIARDFHFPNVLITLTHVDATANLIEARAYISVMPEEKSDTVITTMNKGVYNVQQKINKLLNMRPIPKIIFVQDKITSEAAKVEELLAKLKKEEK